MSSSLPLVTHIAVDTCLLSSPMEVLSHRDPIDISCVTSHSLELPHVQTDRETLGFFLSIPKKLPCLVSTGPKVDLGEP